MTGGIPIKCSVLILICTIILFSLSACKSPKQAGTEAACAGSISGTQSTNAAIETQTTDKTIINPTTVPDTKTTDATVPEKTNEVEKQEDSTGQLLQSASIDLDGDGENEQVEAVQINVSSLKSGTSGKLEGILRISDGTLKNQITFCNKDDGLTGLLTSMQFADLDGDGANDIFIIIPGNGASFSYSNYFIYSYKKGITYSFTNDISLADFIGGFRFKYLGDNKLSIVNDKFSFKADFAIEFEDGQLPSKEYMLDYESRAWIDPVSIDISEASRLALTAGSHNLPEIKVPLPVFGLATVDMIGEIDLFYTVDSSFNPVLKRFEVYDFKDGGWVKSGSCEI